MNNTIYPEDYTDEDKAVYDDLMARGEMLIGKKIAKSDAFLIEMAVKMTIIPFLWLMLATILFALWRSYGEG